MKRIVTLVALAVALVAPASAHAHLIAKPRNSSLSARLVAQQQNLAHARYVCRHGGGEHRRWACRATLWLRRELEETRARIAANTSPTAAIRAVFGRYAAQALAVSSCETGGTFNVYASNGQYQGLFQMGDYARSRYGHGYTPLAQARAAYRYFADAGYDWSPWECKPW